MSELRPGESGGGVREKLVGKTPDVGPLSYWGLELPVSLGSSPGCRWSPHPTGAMLSPPCVHPGKSTWEVGASRKGASLYTQVREAYLQEEFRKGLKGGKIRGGRDAKRAF